jgi:hypothetical protein
VSRFALKPRMRCRRRQEGCGRQGVKQRLKPKETASRMRSPGKGETGRVNESKPSMRLRETRSSQRLNAVILGQGQADPSVACEDTRSPQYRRHPPRLFLAHAERDNPVAVRVMAGKPTARKAESRSGEKMSQQAKASMPKGDGKPAG